MLFEERRITGDLMEELNEIVDQDRESIILIAGKIREKIKEASRKTHTVQKGYCCYYDSESFEMYMAKDKETGKDKWYISLIKMGKNEYQILEFANKEKESYYFSQDNSVKKIYFLN